MSMTDTELCEAINQYMDRVKHPSLCELRNKLNTSTQRLERLRKSPLLRHALPHHMNRSIAATLNRKRNNIAKGWYINRPAAWHDQKDSK